MQKRTKISITKGLLYAFGALLLLYCAEVIFYSQSMHVLAGLTRTIFNHPLVVSNASLQANTNIIKMHRNMKDVVLFSDPAMIRSAISKVDELDKETLEQLRIIEKNILGEEGKQIAAETLKLFQQWVPIRKSVIVEVQRGNRESAAQITWEKGADHVDRLELKMLELTKYARAKAAGFMLDAELVYARIKGWSISLLASWLFLSLCIVFFTIKRTRALEREAAAEREKLDVTIRSIGDGVIVTDTQGEVILVNQVAEALTGWSEKEALGQDIKDVFNIINEITRIPCENPIEKVLATNGIIGLANHTVLLARDGKERAIADSGAPIRDGNQQITGVVLVFRDQSVERQYQDQIIENEKKYRLLSDNTLDVIWTMNLDFDFTFVNRAISSLTGHSENEWLARPLSGHCDEKNFAAMVDIVNGELLKGEESRGFFSEIDILKKNGEPVPVEIRGKVIYDDKSQPIGLQGAVRDISERKIAEKQNRYQENLLRQMGEIAKIGGWDYDPATGEGSWTDEVARIHGLDPKNGKKGIQLGLSFYQGVFRKKLEQAMAQAVDQKSAYDLELELVTAEGDHKWVRTIGVPRVVDGVVVQIRGSFQDITERKNNEQRIKHLNQVLHTIRDINQLIIREKTPDSLIDKCCRLLVDNRGYGCAVIILTDENDQPVSWGRAGVGALSSSVNSCVERGELPLCCEGGSLRNEQGVTIAANLVCSICSPSEKDEVVPKLSAQLIYEGVSFGYLIVALSHNLDIDEEESSLFLEMVGDIAYALNGIRMHEEHKKEELKRERLENQLIQAQKMESVGRLAGGVAHDFNNMLNVIIGYTELVMDEVDVSAAIHNDLVEIKTAAGRATDITRQLLAFARKQTISPQVLNLNDTVESLLKMLRRLIGEDIDLAWLPDADLWSVKIDPTQIDQILANLCVNARDAIADVGKVTIETENISFDEVYCKDHAGFIPGEYAMIAVSDGGCGMDKNTLDSMFEPFFTTKGVGKGTGLGSAMVYGIVKQNNGFMNVYSEVGKGTTIKIYLPRYTGGSVKAIEERLAEVPLASGETVLLVEDENAILRLGRRMLEGLGYIVIDTDSPEKAIDLAKEHAGEIHLLLTDVVMPGMNGRELAIQIEDLYDDVKVLFMSGYTANVIAHRGVLDEGVRFIQKPFSQQTLAQKVRDALDA